MSTKCSAYEKETLQNSKQSFCAIEHQFQQYGSSMKFYFMSQR